MTTGDTRLLRPPVTFTGGLFFFSLLMAFNADGLFTLRPTSRPQPIRGDGDVLWRLMVPRLMVAPCTHYLVGDSNGICPRVQLIRTACGSAMTEKSAALRELGPSSSSQLTGCPLSNGRPLSLDFSI